MTEKLAPNKKELINWEKKSVSDAERISKRLEGRAELEDAATTENAAQLRKQATPTPSPQALNRLRKKIKEVYDDEEDEEDGNTFFNINLLDNEEIYDEEQARARQEKETIRITQEQHMAGKLNAVMSANIAAQSAGLSTKPTRAEASLLNSSEQTPTEIRRQVLKQKITKPLNLRGNLPQEDLPQSIQGIKNVKKRFSEEELSNLPAETMSDFADEKDENELAKLILKKSGRRTPSKRLSEHLRENTPQQNLGLNNDTGKEND